MELLRVEHLSRYYGEGPAQVKALMMCHSP